MNLGHLLRAMLPEEMRKAVTSSLPKGKGAMAGLVFLAF
ncbi:hypothetical protein SeseC_00249 [Streptococcus equi subsp. zooepidemicus ATCC 35246]|nr:hypothetical protein SeseC_00249 [Streptococcus equi subsp. zooepidemicus ATCC 35246]